MPATNGNVATPEQGDKEKRKPIHRIERYVGGAKIQIAIFDKTIETPGRHGGVFVRMTYFVSVAKSYQDKDDNWKNTSVFNPWELQELVDAIQSAHRVCLKLQADADRKAAEQFPEEQLVDDIPF